MGCVGAWLGVYFSFCEGLKLRMCLFDGSFSCLFLQVEACAFFLSSPSVSVWFRCSLRLLGGCGARLVLPLLGVLRSRNSAASEVRFRGEVRWK